MIGSWAAVFRMVIGAGMGCFAGRPLARSGVHRVFGQVFSFCPDVFSFRPNVSTLRPDVSTFPTDLPQMCPLGRRMCPPGLHRGRGEGRVVRSERSREREGKERACI